MAQVLGLKVTARGPQDFREDDFTLTRKPLRV